MGFFWELAKKAVSTAITTEPKKKEDPNVIKNGDWEIYCNSIGEPQIFYKKNKLWFDADDVWSSPSSNFFVCVGYNSAGDECIALTTKAEVLKTKKIEGCLESVLVTDEGKGFALTNEGTLFILTAEKISQRKLGDDDTEETILTPRVAAVYSDDWNGTATIKGIDLDTGIAWKKRVKYGEPEIYGDAPILFRTTDEGFEITMQDGISRYFTPAGEIIEK